MNIMLCARRFASPLVGGVDVYTERLGNALRRLGHQVTVLAVDATDEDQSNGTITTVLDDVEWTKVWRLRFALTSRPREAFVRAYDPEMSQVIEKILQQEEADLFIIVNFYMVTLASVEAAKRLGIPVVHVATDFLPVCQRATLIRWNGEPCQVGESVKTCAECFVSHRFLGRAAALAMNHFSEDRLVQWARGRDSYKPPHPLWILRPYWHQVAAMDERLKTLAPLRHEIDLVLAPTRYTQKMFLENGFRADQVHFLPFGVKENPSLSGNRHLTKTHTRFLFVGRLQPYKGIHLLLQAFNELSAPKEATLTIYGAADGHEAYFDQLQTMMAANKRVHFGGQIPPDQLVDAFAQADYLILPSLWHENSPLILLDALQSRTPVIASDIGGVTDLIQDGVNGLLFPMGDVHALQRVMQRAIDEHPTLAERLRLAANPLNIDDYAKTMFQLLGDRMAQRQPL